MACSSSNRACSTMPADISSRATARGTSTHRCARYISFRTMRASRATASCAAFISSARRSLRASSCAASRVLDVAVDIRKGSPTYGQHVAVELTEDNHRQFFVPRGFAHGFAVLSEEAVFQYKCDNFYHPEADGGISILDTSLGIDWRIPTDKAILSEKDTKHPLLADFDSPFDINVSLY